MLFWKKKPTRELNMSWLQADMHSHLIPGIDDGAQTLEDSIHLIRQLSTLGYKKLITTPHILWEMYPNTRETIEQGLSVVRKALQEQAIDIELHAAAEYYIDDHFQQLLKDKTPLLTLKDNLVLVEFSMISAPFDLQEVLFEMQMQQYQPVIAHPERYIYLRNRKSFFEELRQNGALFQLNLLSLVGHYGTSIQEFATYLLQNGFYDYAGTDLHGERHIQGLQKLANSPLYDLLQNTPFKNSLL
ncbi:MAG TPA: CpsB/CapC family capsule biosynthesis tyrosine phosphatase [Flavisolibacter sp.]|jgi:tyrosine-protein phosphatase YwqE|nr:CpsB/CapC family capsule biosynthesis tyrosine phosphatase [Flavisolibacter sp.]